MFTDEEDDLITNTKNLPCTLSTLSAWYNNKYKQPHSPSKKRKSVSTSEHQRYPPIVIVFEDLENNNDIQVSIQVGIKVFQLLLDIFLYHDFSVLNFIKGLQFCILDHFFSFPCSRILCHHEDLPQTIKNMKHHDIESVRMTPSFMRYVESSPPKEQIALLENDDYTKNDVKDELTELMKTSVQELGQDIHNDLQDIPPDLERLLQRFDTLHEIPEEEEDTDSQEESTLHLEKTDLHNLRKKLMEAGKKSKKLSPYEKLRLEVVDYYDNLFRKYLSCPKSFPLHEVFYYDSAADVKRQLNSSPRSAVQTALATPHHYLQCKCCEMEPGIISSMMPDLCIVYKLHLECTQLINLFDWLQAFVTVVTSEQEEEEGKKKTVEKVLQARFIRAVSELQFLGFIKPTKRKTDHVARLTWGGC
ncbi:ORC3 [Mytilus edulis]|uniref:Origin recognition complex subunit 3 n=1 Tax=Mytilus edulis TaxID=6550 RepID=A0A8S3RZM3_MYTED|nr:ORC3 [Mytilus edulis]